MKKDTLNSLNFNNPSKVKEFAEKCNRIALELGTVNIMEVCGTHTHAIARFGIKGLLAENTRLISGPGCPVCVTPNESIDKMIALAKQPNVKISSFGDMLRVPGSTTSLEKISVETANVKVVYSPLDAIRFAQENPGFQVVFLAVGFETTAPATALAIKRAKSLGLKNFSVFCAHKSMPRALESLANNQNVKLDALLLPGHVSTIIGLEPYRFLAERYSIVGAVSGFEACDILNAVYELLLLLKAQKHGDDAKIVNAYLRGVRDEGNFVARQQIADVFDVCDSEWRGLGKIDSTGYKINKKYANFDAENRFQIEQEPTVNNTACKCGLVLTGQISPSGCPLFRKVCNPQNPIGPCMVSSEGSCSAAFKYSH